MRIVVLAGGLSTEREVSISSGTLVAEALRSKGHEVVLLDVFMGYEENICDLDDFSSRTTALPTEIQSVTILKIHTNYKEAKEKRLDKTSRYIGRNVIEICAEADITFLALHGGEGENGQLQATLDLFGIKYTGSGYLGSALAMNKGLTKSVFMQKNINTPSGELYKNEKDALAWNMFPCIVKPCSGGSSVGVSKVENADQYKKAVKEALKYEDEIVVEQFVTGREFSVGLIGGKALPPIEIAPKSGMYDYAAKYQAGATVETCPADIDEETDKKLRDAATEAYEALHLESYARIDFLLDKGGFTYCLEANTLPGMTPTSLLPQEAAVEGISYPDLCEKIIEISLAKYPKEKSDF